MGLLQATTNDVYATTTTTSDRQKERITESFLSHSFSPKTFFCPSFRFTAFLCRIEWLTEEVTEKGVGGGIHWPFVSSATSDYYYH
jgi:hypothetical protein